MLLDCLFINGRFRTLSPERPVAQALGVVNGRIVGLDEDVTSLPTARVVDLKGMNAVPGFNDAHHHISQEGERLKMVDISPEKAATVADVLRVLAHATGQGGASWIRATGFDQQQHGRFPTLPELDSVTGGRPLWLLHTSGHLGVANSTALRLAGVDIARPPSGLINGGRIETDHRGHATGLVTEGAMALITSLLKPTPLEEWVDCIAVGNRSAIADGITSATETGVVGPGLSGNGPDDIAAFMQAKSIGVLDVRMVLMPESVTLRQPSGDFGYGGLHSGFGDDDLQIGAVKFFIDGSLLGQTAAVSEPFLTNGSLGEFQRDPEELRAEIIAAHCAGWQVACHAIGDRAVKLVLDAYEEAQMVRPRSDARHRIEHAALTDDEDIARMVALGCVPVPQAHFVGAFGDGMLAALGPDRSARCYRQAAFLEAGLTVPGSSDCPVTDGSPLLGIHDLVNRRTRGGLLFGADERLTVDQALFCYTVGSAYASHQEKQKGRLRRGQLADFVTLSEDLCAVDPLQIRDVKVLDTVIGGRHVFGTSW